MQRDGGRPPPGLRAGGRVRDGRGIADPDSDLLAAAEGPPGVTALLLGGSHGAGTADAWSDLDLVVVCPPEAQAGASEAWRAALEARAPLPHWAVRRFPTTTLCNAVTEAFARADLFLVASLAGRAQAGLRVVHDPEGLWDALPDTVEVAPDPARLTALATEFVRVLGLMPVALGREEWALAVRGTGLLRDGFMDAMLEGHAHRGGMLHPSRVLDAGEVAALEGLPAVEAERGSVVAFHRAVAEAALPRMRALCAAHGADWPQALEAAARAAWMRAGVEGWEA